MCCVFVHTNIDNTRRASSPLVTLCGTGAYASGASLATVSFREEFFSETGLPLNSILGNSNGIETGPGLLDPGPSC